MTKSSVIGVSTQYSSIGTPLKMPVSTGIEMPDHHALRRENLLSSALVIPPAKPSHEIKCFEISNTDISAPISANTDRVNRLLVLSVSFRRAIEYSRVFLSCVFPPAEYNITYYRKSIFYKNTAPYQRSAGLHFKRRGSKSPALEMQPRSILKQCSY